MAVTLTAAQQTTLRAFVQNDVVLNAIPKTADGAYALADALNAAANPAWYVWQTKVPINDITDAIDWAKMTPAQAIPTTGSDNQLLWIAKANMCQGKQFNLQNLLIGKTEIAAHKANIRAAFQDCLTALPSKNDGTTQQAGWAAVQLVMSRTCSVLEKVFATGIGTQANPATMAVEGTADGQSLKEQMGW
jgi:hypothetical protein